MRVRLGLGLATDMVRVRLRYGPFDEMLGLG